MQMMMRCKREKEKEKGIGREGEIYERRDRALYRSSKEVAETKEEKEKNERETVRKFSVSFERQSNFLFVFSVLPLFSSSFCFSHFFPFALLLSASLCFSLLLSASLRFYLLAQRSRPHGSLADAAKSPLRIS